MNTTPQIDPGVRVATQRFLPAFIVAFFLFPLPPSVAAGEFETERIVVHLRAGANQANVASAIASQQGREVGRIVELGARAIKVPAGRAARAIEALRNNPNIEYVEPDFAVETIGEPNDPLYPQQWHHAAIGSPGAWATTTGSVAVTIAMIDSGINRDHPDFAGRVLGGYDFQNDDDDPWDDHGHGTTVAGVAAATGNDGFGVAGVDWSSKILPVKVVSSTGTGFVSTMAQGIVYAADNGARVINVSLAIGSASLTLRRAVDYAWEKGCVIVAGAGNSGDDTLYYPASYPNVVSVTAVGRDGDLAAFATFNEEVDLAAPGVGIWTTHRDLSRMHTSVSGTSYATALVSGTAALIAATQPNLTNEEIVFILIEAASETTAHPFGTLDAGEAVGTAALLGDLDDSESPGKGNGPGGSGKGGKKEKSHPNDRESPLGWKERESGVRFRVSE